jgi:hypothetical protein
MDSPFVVSVKKTSGDHNDLHDAVTIRIYDLFTCSTHISYFIRIMQIVSNEAGKAVLIMKYAIIVMFSKYRGARFMIVCLL